MRFIALASALRIITEGCLNFAAISTYREAIKLDPGFSRAYGALAVALVFQYR